MDTTPEYVKMCEKATEIQNTWSLNVGDYYVFEGKVELVASSSHCANPSKPWINRVGGSIWDTPRWLTQCIWLPRQDQLQEMVGDYKTTFSYLHGFFDSEERNEVWAGYDDDYWWSFSSWEQLWLAIAMNEKYGKKWTGTEWST